MKFLVDGVFFQLNDTGIARVWCSLLELLAKEGRFELYVLDRGRAPDIANITFVPFPSFTETYCPADSQLIQAVCDEYNIDVFSSTYYTTPISTPMVLMVHDMIPELFGFDLSARVWMEKETAICYAQRFLCVSQNTRNDLLSIYPEILPANVSVAYNGIDPKRFKVREPNEIETLKKKFGLDRPYFLFVGDRVQHKGYKNSALFFDALAGMPDADFDVFCIGGEPDIDASIRGKVPDTVRCFHAKVTDEELAIAYAGALSLVYPSLYEGFGMPVVEAMASGCPVITTNRGALSEAAGDAAYTIAGDSVEEMRQALQKLQDPELRQELRRKGIAHAAHFRWPKMVAVLVDCLERVVEEARAGQYDRFFDAWKEIRNIQSHVDYSR